MVRIYHQNWLYWILVIMRGFNANRFSGTLQLNKPSSMYISENLISDIIVTENEFHLKFELGRVDPLGRYVESENLLADM